MKNNFSIKVMKNKPPLTDEEIRSQMDFDKLLQLSQSAGSELKTPSFKKIASVAYVASVVLILIVMLYFATIKRADQTLFDPNSITNPSVSSVDSLTDVEGAQSSDKQSEVVVKKLPAENSNPVTQKTEHTPKGKIGVPKFIEAEPVDGYPSLYQYFNEELMYPQEITKDSIEGMMTISFAINKLGRPEEIKIGNSLGLAFDKECIRVIENMPPWKPATVNGNPTVVRLSVPLTFTIKKN